MKRSSPERQRFAMHEKTLISMAIDVMYPPSVASNCSSLAPAELRVVNLPKWHDLAYLPLHTCAVGLKCETLTALRLRADPDGK